MRRRSAVTLAAAGTVVLTLLVGLLAGWPGSPLADDGPASPAGDEAPRPSAGSAPGPPTATPPGAQAPDLLPPPPVDQDGNPLSVREMVEREVALRTSVQTDPCASAAPPARRSVPC